MTEHTELPAGFRVGPDGKIELLTEAEVRELLDRAFREARAVLAPIAKADNRERPANAQP